MMASNLIQIDTIRINSETGPTFIHQDGEPGKPNNFGEKH